MVGSLRMVGDDMLVGGSFTGNGAFGVDSFAALNSGQVSVSYVLLQPCDTNRAACVRVCRAPLATVWFVRACCIARATMVAAARLPSALSRPVIQTQVLRAHVLSGTRAMV